MLRTLGYHEMQHLAGQSRNDVAKTFRNGRAFTIMATPDHGIVVVDNDSRRVIVKGPDLGFRSHDSAEGKADTAELHRIRKMRWTTFSTFCREHPFYEKGIATDIDAGLPPHAPDLINQGILSGEYPGRGGADIRTSAMAKAHAAPKGRYRFPFKTREDIIVFIASHHLYEIEVDPIRLCIAWDVRLPEDLDLSGKAGPAPTDARFDDKWAAWAEQNDLFLQACEKAARRRFGDLRPANLPEGGPKAAGFCGAGSQNGHVILMTWDGPVPLPRRRVAMSFNGSGHYIEWLRALKSRDLTRLYRLVAIIDRDIDDRVERVTDEINLIRASMERKWSREVSRSSAK